ncbi:MAG: hypothetical protein JNK58_08335 [Phycisphaerae bacterium]|nr:hypothetical protein [Phycisphaerae bacterium]
MNTAALSRLSLLFLLAASLSACSNRAPLEPSPMWVQAAAPRFVTLGRSTNYALVHRAGQDLLIVEDPIVSESSDNIAGRMTWIVPLPDQFALDKPISVGGPGSEAWLLEQVWNGQGHATPAKGNVIVHHRDADQLSASLHMQAFGAAPSAGQPERATIELDRKFDFARRVITTPQYREMGPRSGIRKPPAE